MRFFATSVASILYTVFKNNDLTFSNIVNFALSYQLQNHLAMLMLFHCHTKKVTRKVTIINPLSISPDKNYR